MITCTSRSLETASTIMEIAPATDNSGWVKIYNLKEIQGLAKNFAGEKSLAEAMSELAELDDYAIEEELMPSSPTAKTLAKNILDQLTSELPRDYSISLWEDGDVVVYSGGNGWRVNVFCRTNGGASLYVTSPDNRADEHHYQLARDMPISLVVEALKKIPA